MTTNDDEQVIVLPELSVRFRRQGYRWTYAIEAGTDPCVTIAKPVEWDTAGDDPTRVISPVYQEIHFQGGGDEALLVGMAGSHYFSASVRGSHSLKYVYEHGTVFGYAESEFEFDIASRCSTRTDVIECNFEILIPPADYHFGNSKDAEASQGFVNDWRDSLVWLLPGGETDLRLTLRGAVDPSTRVALMDRTPRAWSARIAPEKLVTSGTNRIYYTWSLLRVFEKGDEQGDVFP